MSVSNQNFDVTNPFSNKIQQPSRTLISPWLMWITSVSFVLFQFCLQLSAGVMIGDLIKTFKLTALGAGILSGSYYFIYVFMQTPAGILVDRIGPRRLLSGGAIVCSIGCGLFALSQNLVLACFARVLMGGGSSFAFVSTLYLIGKWFPKERFAMMTGLAETVGMVGTIMGNILLAHYLQQTSWRNVMWISALIALFLGALCCLIIRDKPTKVALDEAPSMKRFVLSLNWMFHQPGLWLNGLYSGLIFGVVTVFGALWSLPYLMLVQQVSLSTATFESTFIFVGMAIGGPIMGMLYYKVQNKNQFLSMTALLSTIFSLWIIYATPRSIALTSLLFASLGFMCSSYVFNYTLAKESTPRALHATSIGFTNTLCMITAPLFQFIVGWLLSLGLNLNSTVEVPSYSISNYYWALAIIPINQLLAGLTALYIPRRRSRR